MFAFGAEKVDEDSNGRGMIRVLSIKNYRYVADIFASTADDILLISAPIASPIDAFKVELQNGA